MGNCVVTGSRSGIGAAIKPQMIDKGYSVIVAEIKHTDLSTEPTTNSS
ncbi:hypothetical protein [Microbulbifer sp. 2304DJ12-6]